MRRIAAVTAGLVALGSLTWVPGASAQGPFTGRSSAAELAPSPAEIDDQIRELEKQLEWVEKELGNLKRLQDEELRSMREMAQLQMGNTPRLSMVVNINMLIAKKHEIKGQIAELVSQKTKVGGGVREPGRGMDVGGPDDRIGAAEEQLRRVTEELERARGRTSRSGLPSVTDVALVSELIAKRYQAEAELRRLLEERRRAPTAPAPMPVPSTPPAAVPPGVAAAAPGFIGAAMVDIDPAMRSALGLPAGALVTGLAPGDPPARQAGLQPGDYIVAIDGRATADAAGTVGILAGSRPGSTLTLTVVRGGHVVKVPVHVAERPRGLTP